MKSEEIDKSVQDSNYMPSIDFLNDKNDKIMQSLNFEDNKSSSKEDLIEDKKDE